MAALTPPVPTASEACPPIAPPAATATTAPGGAGIRVSVDPATGRIRRATTGERRRIALSAGRDRSGRTYEVHTRPDGTRVVKLDDAFAMSIVATVGPDGKMSYRCGTDSVPAGARAESAD
jgi:hypothetical protein